MVRDCSRVTYKTNLEVLTHKWPVLRSCAPDETETALSKLLNWAFEHIIQNDWSNVADQFRTYT